MPRKRDVLAKLKSLGLGPVMRFDPISREKRVALEDYSKRYKSALKEGKRSLKVSQKKVGGRSASRKSGSILCFKVG